jgi:uncharacterized protein
MRIPVRDTKDGARLAVRVAPRASRTAIVGVVGDGDAAAVKIALQAPPVEGRANEALVEFLAELLGVRRADIAIAAGEHGRNKIMVVRGRRAAEVAAAVKKTLGGTN